MMRYVCNQVDYALHEAGSGDPLLVLHGFTGAGASFLAHLNTLKQHHRLLAPDLLGHGETYMPADPARYTMPHATADLATLCDALGYERLPVLGYSMGGRLGLAFALTYPQHVSALILESASAGLATSAERHARLLADTALAERIRAHGIAHFVDEWERLPLWESQKRLAPALRQQLHQQRLRNHPHGLANSLIGMGTGAQPFLGNQLAELTCPTLLITGAKDAKFVAIADALVAQLPHARHISIADAGHTVHLEANDAYQEAIRDFLKRV